jgi:hypothetical protein
LIDCTRVAVRAVHFRVFAVSGGLVTGVDCARVIIIARGLREDTSSVSVACVFGTWIGVFTHDVFVFTLTGRLVAAILGALTVIGALEIIVLALTDGRIAAIGCTRVIVVA